MVEERPNECSIFFIKRLYIAGKWLGEVPTLTFAAVGEAGGEEDSGLQIGNSTFLTADEFVSRVRSSLVKIEKPIGNTAIPHAVNKHTTTMTAKIQCHSMVRLIVSWVSERVSDSHVAQSLWLPTSGMSSLHMPIGGLLGIDDHATVSEASVACQVQAGPMSSYRLCKDDTNKSSV